MHSGGASLHYQKTTHLQGGVKKGHDNGCIGTQWKNGAVTR